MFLSLVWRALAVLLVSAPHASAVQSQDVMQADVDRLVRAARALTTQWPGQPPPPVPEVSIVAGHGRDVVPRLILLLADDPDAERDRPPWTVQQQVSLALSRIYDELVHCGRIYCDGDPPERIAAVKEGWLRVIAADNELRSLSRRELLDRFRAEPLFWRQFEIARRLAACGCQDVVGELEAWMTHDDRHRRANAAYVLGRLGDPRGFATLAGILTDRSARPIGQGVPGGRWTVRTQVRADRYYAARLLGDLRDSRAVDLLVPLLNDDDVDHIVPWSLARIGDRRAIGPLIALTDRDDPSLRVLAIGALEQLDAREALPRLRHLLGDDRPSTFGNQVTVAQAAAHALAALSR